LSEYLIDERTPEQITCCFSCKHDVPAGGISIPRERNTFKAELRLEVLAPVPPLSRRASDNWKDSGPISIAR